MIAAAPGAPSLRRCAAAPMIERSRHRSRLMSAPALRPRSAAELVDAAFQVLRAHYGQLVVCSAIAYVPMLLLRLFVIGDTNRFIGSDPTVVQREMLVTMLWTALGSLVTYSLMSAVLVVLTSQAYLGEVVDVGDAVRRVIPRVVQVLVASLLRSLLVILGLFPGIILLCVPMFYVVARYFAVIPAIVLEEAGTLRSFSRSSELSRGRKLHILGTLVLVTIIYYLLVVGISLIGTLTGNFVVQTTVSSVGAILVYPVVAITEALLYYDARIRSEGLDIELMTDALDAPPGLPAV